VQFPVEKAEGRKERLNRENVIESFLGNARCKL